VAKNIEFIINAKKEGLSNSEIKGKLSKKYPKTPPEEIFKEYYQSKIIIPAVIILTISAATFSLMFSFPSITGNIVQSVKPSDNGFVFSIILIFLSSFILGILIGKIHRR
jgi:hypothetical protein